MSYCAVYEDIKLGTYSVNGEPWNGMVKLSGNGGIIIVEDWRQRFEHILQFGKESEAEVELLKASPGILAKIGDKPA